MQKQRHGCLTAWLVLVIVINTLVALLYLFGSSAVASALPSSRSWAIPVLAVLAVANVAFAVALFLWKRWGFYGFVATSVVGFALNIALGVNVAQALFGLAGVAILYGVLQIGNENKGWPQLE
jgi:hypothetical protein